MYELARILYNFENDVINLNNRSSMHMILSDPALNDFAQHVFMQDPRRNQILIEEVPDIRARPEDEGRSAPLGLTVIHNSPQNYQLLVPLVFPQGVQMDQETRLRTFSSLVDYAMRFSRGLIPTIVNDAINRAQIMPPTLFNRLLNDRRFLAAATLVPILQQRGDLAGDQNLVERIVHFLFNLANVDDVNAIRFFFSTGLQQLVPDQNVRAEIMRVLVERVLMRVVQVGPETNRPNREEVSLAIGQGLVNSIPTSEMRDHLLNLARASEQYEMAEWLAGLSFESMSFLEGSSSSDSFDWRTGFR